MDHTRRARLGGADDEIVVAVAVDVGGAEDLGRPLGRRGG